MSMPNVKLRTPGPSPIDEEASPKPAHASTANPHKASRFSTFVSTLVVCGVLIGAGWWLLASQHQAVQERSTQRGKTSEPAVITVAEVTPRVVQRTVAVVGSLYGQEEIVIRAKVGGRVAEVLHEVGDRVLTGDALLRIERTDYELAVAEAQRSLELELSKLGIKELPGGDFDTTQLPSVVRARVEEQNAQSRLNRIRELSKRQVLTGEELESAETTFTVARVNSQQMRLDAQSMLASAHHRQAALNSALAKLSETDVVVPGSSRRGSPSSAPRQEYVVADRSIAVGEMISTTPGADSGLFKLIIDNPLKLVSTLPERHKSEIQLGQEVELRVEYSPTIVFPGTVARINPVVDRASRTFEVEIMVPNEERRLSPGSFVRALIRTHIDDQAPTVPEQSLVKLAGVTKVFVVKDSTAHEAQVTPQSRIIVAGHQYPESWIEIGNAVPVGSMIATSGFAQLSDGCPVRIRSLQKSATTETHP